MSVVAPEDRFALRRNACRPVFDIAMFGVRIALRSDRPDLAGEFRAALPPELSVLPASAAEAAVSISLGEDDAPPPGRHLLFCGAEIYRMPANRAALRDEIPHLLRFAVAQHSDDPIFVHAGVVAWNGRAALFPGSSHAGKSTLVSALVERGADYMSDEHAMLGPTGLAWPWHKPLTRRVPGGGDQIAGPVGQRQTITRPLPVRWIVVTAFAPGAVFAPEDMTVAQAVTALFEHTVAARRHAVRAMDVLIATAGRARCLRAPRGDAGEAADAICALFARDA